LRAPLAAFAAVAVAISPVAGYAQSDTTRYEIFSGYVIDIPTAWRATRDATLWPDEPTPGWIALLALISAPGATGVVMVDEATMFDSNYEVLFTADDADLVPRIGEINSAEGWGQLMPTLTEVRRTEGDLIVRVSTEFRDQPASSVPTAIDTLFVVRPADSFVVHQIYVGLDRGAVPDVLGSVRRE
jgi:hypothetical protein